MRADTFHFVGPMMDKKFRACTVPYVERLALHTKLTLARKNSKVRHAGQFHRQAWCTAASERGSAAK